MNAWTDLGDGTRLRRSRVFAMNSVLLRADAHAVLVDPGVLPSDLDALAAAARGADVVLVFTHAHWDHVLGRPWWPEARTVGHARLADELHRDGATILAEAVKCAHERGERWEAGFVPFAVDEPVTDQRTLEIGPWRLVVRAAPGHCDSQVTVHLPAQRLLLAGDMLSDVEVPWLDGPPAIYRATIERLARLVEAGEVETLVPGHGHVARGTDAVHARIRRDLRYLDALDEGVREARAAGLTLEQARARLAAIAPTDLSDAFPLAQVHRENVRFAWTAPAD